MDEYIEREALRDALYDADAITMQGVKLLNQFPAADAVPVVRCKDCKYFKTPLCQIEDNHDNWFCADGERKDKDGNG